MNFNNNTYDPEPDENGNYNSPAGWVPNPLDAINNFKFYQNVNRMLSNIKFNFALMDGLNMNFNIGSDWYNQDATAYIPIGSHGAPNGYARAALKNFQRLNADLNINYVTSFGEFIKSTSALGMSAQRDKRHTSILTSDKISPFVETVSGDITGKTDVTGERSIQGLYLQQTFGLWDKLFITGAVRWDQASPFGINSRTQFYPKASVSYLLSDNDFWKNSLGFINTFKIRASYGESGNMSALSDYERFSNYGDVNYVGDLGFVPSTAMGNENVKPERQKETEFGIDFSMFNNRFGGEFSWYNVDVSDLLLQIELAPSTGFSSRYENIGTMNNKGIELSLKGVPVQTKDLSWKVTGTFSKNKNVVNDIPGDQVTLHNTFGIVRAINGYPLGVHYGYYYHRDENGDIWVDDNGLPKRAVDENGTKLKKVIADPNPDYVASLINELSFGKFTFRLQLDQVKGFDVFNFTDRVNSHPSFAGGHYDEDELEGKLPKGYNKAAYNIWERYIEDGSFIKVRELYLGYNFDKGILGISNLNVYISGRNLYSFDNYLGWDPETSTAGQSNGVRGFDFNEVPIPRTLKIGLNATF
ncbi:MAG TPA: TonB-dependent receptor [Bacteroidetes bacterium]|nr:TonB-dependent receptor [Bacteroidota bacterium]